MSHPPTRLLISRFFDVLLNRGDGDAIAACLAPTFCDHTGFLGLPAHEGEFAAWLRAFRAAFPDGRYRVDDIVPEAGTAVVATTFQGTHLGPYLRHEPTGAKVTVRGVHLLRMSDGLITEHRGYENLWGLLTLVAGPSTAGLREASRPLGRWV